jgi:predicted ATPase
MIILPARPHSRVAHRLADLLVAESQIQPHRERRTHSAALAEALAQATGAIPMRLEKIDGETRVAGMRAGGELGEE